jgi:demethylsterigmatocystin 6-O-methyltransferase
MAPAFVHFPSYFALNNYREPTAQETGPYAAVFNRTYWQNITSTPKLKSDLDTYMAAHKQNGSSLADLLPLPRLVEGYNSAFPVLLVDIGGGVGHQCKDLRARYPSLQGDIVVQDLQSAPDLDLAGIKGMAYNFFEPQPIKGKLKPEFFPMIDASNLRPPQMRGSTITAPSYTTGQTPSASRSSET